MTLCALLRLSRGSLLVILVLCLAIVAHSAPMASTDRMAGTCVECGLLYKFCPQSVGCGYADPSGITCYCQDWTWCSDLPDCSMDPPEEPAAQTDLGYPIIMKLCNASDPLQWIVSMDIYCNLFQPISFSPRTVLNDIIVLTSPASISSSNHSVYGSPLNMTMATQLWQYSNLTIRSQIAPDHCLDFGLPAPQLVSCSATTGTWTYVASQTDYSILQYTSSSYCLAIDPR